MTYTVYPRTPEDAVNLAALFALCQGTKPVAGGYTGKQHRATLAESLEDAAVRELLRSGREIQVRPRSATSWVIEDVAAPGRADRDLGRILRAELREQRISEAELARKSGVSQKTVNNTLAINAATSPRWDVLRKVLAGLGKDLMWLAMQLDKPTE